MGHHSSRVRRQFYGDSDRRWVFAGQYVGAAEQLSAGPVISFGWALLGVIAIVTAWMSYRY